MTYTVEVYRDEHGRPAAPGRGEWHVVGQYSSRAQARAVAADYQARGETARVLAE